ncbi:MAG: transposase [Acetilactobacillus jinshanensis]
MLRNHKLAQKISDVGWRAFLSMLQRKAKMYGKNVILVNPAYTTQMCSKCGFICTRSNGLSYS